MLRVIKTIFAVELILILRFPNEVNCNKHNILNLLLIKNECIRKTCD